MLPVEPPVHVMFVGMVTVMLKSCANACDKPFTPGTLLVTDRLVKDTPALPDYHESIPTRITTEAQGLWLTSLVEVTKIGTSSICVDLVDGHCNCCSSLDLGDGASGKHVLGVLADIDVTRQFSSSTFIHDVGCDFRISDDGCVLLARVDRGAISWESEIDWKE